MRAFSLLEVAVVIAILGVLAALAAPQLNRVIAQSRDQAEMEAVASFLDSARQMAVSEGRCTRVVLRAPTLRIERRITGDCFNIGAQLGAAGWERVSDLKAPAGVTYQIANQSLTLPAAPANDDDHRIVFRGSGRLHGDGDVVVTDDAARVVLAPSTGGDFRAAIVTAVGRICTKNHGATLPAPAIGVLQCP